MIFSLRRLALRFWWFVRLWRRSRVSRGVGWLVDVKSVLLSENLEFGFTLLFDTFFTCFYDCRRRCDLYEICNFAYDWDGVFKQLERSQKSWDCHSTECFGG